MSPETHSLSHAQGAALDAAARDRCRVWYEQHGEAVYNYVRFQVPEPDAAEDIVADTFVRALRAARRYDEARGGARGWLLAIARNLVHDYRRRSRVGRLLDALGTLNDSDRELVSLRYASGLDGGEVAELLGISEGMVRTRLWRALKRLKTALKELE